MSSTHVRKRWCVFVLLALFDEGRLVPSAYGQTFELCNATAVIEECTHQNRTCVRNVDEGREYCDQCLKGYIPDFASTADVRDCILIEGLAFRDYVNTFEPLFGELLADEVRLGFLVATALLVSAHNAQFPPPDFYLELNELSAFSENEISQRNGYRFDNDTEDDILFFDFGDNDRVLQTLPSSVNWVTAGAVTSVKNQGQCGCCWSLSAVGAVEGAVAIDSNFAYLQSLSFQQLISCDTSNYGCNGGSVTAAMQYTEDNSFGGLTTNEDYPFADQGGITSSTCTVSSDQLAVEVRNTRMITTTTAPSDYKERLNKMKQGVAKQPISILFSGNCGILYSYSGGVMTSDGSCSCSRSSCLDHAVLLVGYDDTALIPYWLIKNSWGASWGENGYFRVAQTVSDAKPWGLFGLLSQGTIATKAFNTTQEVQNSSSSAAPSLRGESIAGSTIIVIICGNVLVIMSGFGWW